MRSGCIHRHDCRLPLAYDVDGGRAEHVPSQSSLKRLPCEIASRRHDTGAISRLWLCLCVRNLGRERPLRLPVSAGRFWCLVLDEAKLSERFAIERLGEIVAVCAGAGGALRRTQGRQPLRPADRAWRPDCVAGHTGFEPANQSARYLIGITWQLRLRKAQAGRRRAFAFQLHICSLEPRLQQTIFSAKADSMAPAVVRRPRQPWAK
jgi:hypothetical protein